MYPDSVPAMAEKKNLPAAREEATGRKTGSDVPEYRLMDGAGHRDEGLAVVAIERHAVAEIDVRMDCAADGTVVLERLDDVAEGMRLHAVVVVVLVASPTATRNEAQEQAMAARVICRAVDHVGAVVKIDVLHIYRSPLVRRTRLPADFI